MKICRENLNILKIGHEYRLLCLQLQESLIAAADIKSP